VRVLRSSHLQHTREDLEIRARLLRAALPATFPNVAPDSLQQFCSEHKVLAAARITIVGRDGHALGFIQFIMWRRRRLTGSESGFTA